MKKMALIGALLALIIIPAYSQIPDTSSIYGERVDSLAAAVSVGRQFGNYLSKGKEIRTEVISAAGLCKMACCSLAESFENSASVSVGYSDAVTGARQIRLLGQNGVYTQMLDENRPVMRGLSAPWGLSFIPGQWLESIQIAKGSTSVINGVESMTGQINMEHRKPTDEKPLYIQASYMSDTKTDLNVISSLQLDPLSTWSTVIMGHLDGNFESHDHNGDGFMDDPRQKNAAFSNRWLYFGRNGVQVRFGLSAAAGRREGGEMKMTDFTSRRRWSSDIRNRSLDAYVKVGIPLNEGNTRNIAAVADYNFQMLDGGFGNRQYSARQNSAFVNLLYQDQDNEQHHLTMGASAMLDRYDESLGYMGSFPVSTPNALSDVGVFGEYTFHSEDETTLSAILGIRGDWYGWKDFRFSPRLTVRWCPVDQLVFRANGGRGIRYSTPLTDNIGVLSTGKNISGDFLTHPLEDSWTFGGNVTWYLPSDESGKTCLSLDYFHTSFTEQMLVDYVGSTGIYFYALSSVGGAISHTENIQVDFSSEPFKGFSITLTGRLTDARQTLAGCADGIKPMTSRYKGVLNLQYATNLNKWLFDFTASLNGPCRVWDFMKSDSRYADGYTPVYPLLFLQVTKRFKGFDVYVGGENLTNYRQMDPIIGAGDPFGTSFDASCIWGPLTGAMVYAGIRMTIWKTQ